MTSVVGTDARPKAQTRSPLSRKPSKAVGNDEPTTTTDPGTPESVTTRAPRRSVSQANVERRTDERHRQSQASTQMLRARLESSAKPTSLLTEQLGDGEENCLEQAADTARPGQDDIVFLEDRRAGNDNAAGHTLVRDRENGRVTDPTTGGRFATTDEWIAAQGTGADGGPPYVETAAVPAETVQDVLSVPPSERADRIAAHGDPNLSRVANQLYADDPIDPARRGEIDAFTREHAEARFPGRDTVEALRGESGLGEMTAAEQSYLVGRTVDRWQVNDDFVRLEMGSNTIAREIGRNNPELRPVVADAFASRALRTARNGDRESELHGVTLASAAVNAAGTQDERRQMIDRLGPDAAGLVTALRPADDTIFGAWTPMPGQRAESVGALLDATGRGATTPATAAVTQAAFEQLPVDAYERSRALPGQMGRALARHWHPGDPTAQAREAERFTGVLETRQGRELLGASDVPPQARADAIALFRANPDLDASLLREHDGSGWTHPEINRRLAAPRARDFLELRGDTPQTLDGTNLDNTVGFAMGLPAHVPENETDAERAAREARVAEGGHSYYADGEHAGLVAPVVDSIRNIGGADPRVTVLPIQYSSEETGPVQLSLFRVQDQANGQDRFVDNTGRTYESFEEWRTNNELPPGNMVYPPGGHIRAGADGQPQLGSENTPETVDTFGEHALRVLDGAALVGGVVAGGAIIIGSGGTAAPFVLAGASLYGAGRSAANLYDRATHGQSIDPINDSAARSEWLNLGANALGFAGAGATMGAMRLARSGHALTPLAATTAGVLNATATAADGAAILDTGHTLLTRWDDLSGGERAQLGLSMAFWGASTAARPRMANARPINAFDATAMRNGIIQSGRRTEPLRPNSSNFTPGAQISQDFSPTMSHMFAPGAIGTRSRGINGGHRPADFNAALQGQGQVLSRREVPGFPGMSVVDYRMNAMNADGTPSGRLANRPQQKTLLDPAVWTPEETQRLMRDVFGDVHGNGTVMRTVNGTEFIGWVRNGELQSFGVNLPAQ